MKFVLAAAMLMISVPALAGTPKNALGALAVSPDGTRVVAAGDNLALYVLDAKDLSVISRHWIGLNPEELAFSADGKTLLAIDINSSLHFLNAETFEVDVTIEKLASAAVMREADEVVAIAKPVRVDGKRMTPFAIYALADGKEKVSGVADTEGTSVGGKSDGTGFAILARYAQSADETKEKAPDDVQGLEKVVFQQKHDGKVSDLLLFDRGGKEVARHTLWFSTTGTLSMALLDDKVYGVNYSDENVRIDAATGDVEMFEVKSGSNYGIGFSPDHSILATGSLAQGTIGRLGVDPVAFKTDQVGTWPEYVKGFAFAPDGSVFAGTTAYRLIAISADGKVIASRSIF